MKLWRPTIHRKRGSRALWFDGIECGRVFTFEERAAALRRLASICSFCGVGPEAAVAWALPGREQDVEAVLDDLLEQLLGQRGATSPGAGTAEVGP